MLFPNFCSEILRKALFLEYHRNFLRVGELACCVSGGLDSVFRRPDPSIKFLKLSLTGIHKDDRCSSGFVGWGTMVGHYASGLILIGFLV